MSLQELIDYISEYIHANGNQEITGDIQRDVLVLMAEVLYGSGGEIDASSLAGRNIEYEDESKTLNVGKLDSQQVGEDLFLKSISIENIEDILYFGSQFLGVQITETDVLGYLYKQLSISNLDENGVGSKITVQENLISLMSTGGIGFVLNTSSVRLVEGKFLINIDNIESYFSKDSIVLGISGSNNFTFGKDYVSFPKTLRLNETPSHPLDAVRLVDVSMSTYEIDDELPFESIRDLNIQVRLNDLENAPALVIKNSFSTGEKTIFISYRGMDNSVILPYNAEHHLYLSQAGVYINIAVVYSRNGETKVENGYILVKKDENELVKGCIIKNTGIKNI